MDFAYTFTFEETDGVAGFLLANGALNDSDTLEIRKELIQNDKIEAIVVLPRELFITTDISVTLWILNQNKKVENTMEEISEIASMRYSLWIYANGQKMLLRVRAKRKFG